MFIHNYVLQRINRDHIFTYRLKSLLILQVLFELPKQMVKLKKRQLLTLPPMWYAKDGL